MDDTTDSYITYITPATLVDNSVSEMTYIVSGGALNSTHSPR